MVSTMAFPNTLAPASFALFAANDDGGAGFIGLCGSCVCPLVFGLVIALVVIIPGWKVFTKAGRPGWEVLVPVYSAWIMVTEICKLEPLWFFMLFIPFVGQWKVSMELAQKFGKSEGFGWGLFLLTPIFLLMLAFGDAKYIGNKRKKRYDDEEDEDDQRPRSRSRRDEEEEEEEERPRSRGGRRDEEEDEERPRNRRRDDDDDDEEEERPRRRR